MFSKNSPINGHFHDKDEAKPKQWFIEAKKIYGEIYLEAHGPEIPDGARRDVIEYSAYITEKERAENANKKIDELQEHIYYLRTDTAYADLEKKFKLLQDMHSYCAEKIIDENKCQHTLLNHNLGDPNFATCLQCLKKVQATWSEA